MKNGFTTIVAYIPTIHVMNLSGNQVKRALTGLQQLLSNNYLLRSTIRTNRLTSFSCIENLSVIWTYRLVIVEKNSAIKWTSPICRLTARCQQPLCFWILDLSVNKNLKAIGHGTSWYSFCKAIFAFDGLRLVA